MRHFVLVVFVLSVLAGGKQGVLIFFMCPLFCLCILVAATALETGDQQVLDVSLFDVDCVRYAMCALCVCYV